MDTYQEFMNLQQKYLAKQAMLEQEYLSVLKQTGYPVSPEELGSILIQRLITKMENEELPAGKSAMSINKAPIEGCEISQELASSVLDRNIIQQLGDEIEYNGAGSFIICDGRNDMPKNLGMSRVIVNNIDEKRRPAEASAWLTGECLQKAPSSAAYAPPGYIAQYTLKNDVNLYTRGHLIAATFGNVNGEWNAKTNNHLNIVTQTQWANQSSTASNKGQAYYEKILRNILATGGVVNYRVRPLYSGKNKIPSGNQLMARWFSFDDSGRPVNEESFNVFVPNVQNGWEIDYASGQARKVRKKQAS
ncbi:DNA/RNA non-specific endonuclease [Ligilactobacillus sp.]|uniref:DNA/RNA non-specific endonuclease n=1 Tax=Ligilactobacillus sp. TaxID=2767921 RepID=UPI002FE2FE9E